MGNNMDSYSIRVLHEEREKIKRLAKDSAFLYLNDLGLINQYISGENSIAESYITDFQGGRLNFSDAMSKLRGQYNVLLKTYMDLQMENAKLYFIVEKSKKRIPC